MMKYILLLTSAAFFPAFALAQSKSKMDDIVVTGAYHRSQIDILQSTSVMKAEDLQRDMRATIGDSLLRLPGVSATGFAPGASRPVIRGQQGERVRVLTDGIGSIDASNTSADHAVAGETLTAERVEVLRGPATLLFGSSGIGGVVNIIDNRIPGTLQGESYRGAATAVFGSAANERGASATLNAKISPGVVLHADGSYRKSDDMRIGAPAISRPLAKALGVDRADVTARRLLNSDFEVKSFGVGATGYTNDGDDFLGIAASRFMTNYGSPIEEAVRIDLKQTRVDLKAGLTVESGFFETVKLRFGWADYKHQEVDAGTVGTTFLNKGWEARAELVQRQHGFWHGALGLQYAKRDFAAIGEESFVPPNLTQQFGLFTLQEFNLDPLKLEASARFEHSQAESKEIDVARSFNTFNASFGGTYGFSEGFKLGAALTRAVRAPAAEELFANGPHIATGVFEVGDVRLRPEKSWNAELNFHIHNAKLEMHGAVYHSWFKDYVFEQLNGDVQDGLPVAQFAQAEARYFGLELQSRFKAYQNAGRSVSFDLTGDYVRATNATSQSPLPRIPALRLLGGVRFETDILDAGAEVEWANKQNRVAAYELPTDSYTTVNASVTWRPLGKEAGVALILEGNNLFDAEIRRHASFTKDRVPASGRDVRISARWSF
jgi:iron complex outermembrane recepter protein